MSRKRTHVRFVGNGTCEVDLTSGLVALFDEVDADSVRLGRQALAVFELMRDGSWRTLREITEAIGVGSEAGVSARLRDFRKARFGGYVVNRQRRGEESLGVFEYQLIIGGKS